MSSKATKRKKTTKIDTPRPQKRFKFTAQNWIVDDKKEGLLLATGAGDLGQLGLGPDVQEKTRFALLTTDHKIIDVCAGGVHTVCLTSEGKVLTFGCNDEGALGRVTEENEEDESTPGEVQLPGKAVQISAGDSHSAALLEDGRVFAWGTFRDSHGNLGLSPRGNEKLPYQMMDHSVVIKISSGADHIVFLTNEGKVYTCGCAEQGQLGRITERSCDRNARGGVGKTQLGNLLEPAQIVYKVSLKLFFEDVWAATYGTFVKVAGKNDIYVFGLNNYKQLGLSATRPQYAPKLSKEFSKYKWKQICGAPHHSIALDKDGKTYAIGRKEYGRLGLGKDCEDAVELVEIPGLKGKNVTCIATGSSTSFAVTDQGELYAWGMGTSGQLGTGSEDDCNEPTLIKSKQLTDRHIFKVSGGGQHTVILAVPNVNNNQNQGDSSVNNNQDQGDANNSV